MSIEARKQGNEVWSDRKVDLYISWILRTGVIAASVLTAIGGIIYLQSYGQELPHLHQFHRQQSLRSIGAIVDSAAHWHGEAIIQLGVLILLFTPIMRVAFACYAFLRQRDAIFTAVSGIVLSLLLFSVLARH